MSGLENTLGSFWGRLGKETQAPAAHAAGLGWRGRWGWSQQGVSPDGFYTLLVPGSSWALANNVVSLDPAAALGG